MSAVTPISRTCLAEWHSDCHGIGCWCSCHGQYPDDLGPVLPRGGGIVSIEDVGSLRSDIACYRVVAVVDDRRELHELKAWPTRELAEAGAPGAPIRPFMGRWWTDERVARQPDSVPEIFDEIHIWTRRP